MTMKGSEGTVHGAVLLRACLSCQGDSSSEGTGREGKTDQLETGFLSHGLSGTGVTIELVVAAPGHFPQGSESGSRGSGRGAEELVECRCSHTQHVGVLSPIEAGGAG